MVILEQTLEEDTGISSAVMVPASEADWKVRLLEQGLEFRGAAVSSCSTQWVAFARNLPSIGIRSRGRFDSRHWRVIWGQLNGADGFTGSLALPGYVSLAFLTPHATDRQQDRVGDLVMLLASPLRRVRERQAMTPLRIAVAGDAWFRTKNVSATGQVADEDLHARLQQSLEQIQQRYDLIASQVDTGRYESAERNIRLLEQALPAVGQLVAQVVAGGEPCQVVLSGLPTDAAMKRIEELEQNQQQSSGQSAEAIAQQLKMLEPVKKLDAIVRGILSQVDWARWAPGERGG